MKYKFKTSASWKTKSMDCFAIFMNSSCPGFLLKNWAINVQNIPNEKGVYCIIDSQSKIPVSKGLLSQKTLDDKLYNQLNQTSADSRILYIGETEGSLKTRIRQYMNALYNGGQNHQGGIVIKDIPCLDELECRYLITERPVDVEKLLLAEFKADHGDFPFANWRY